MAELIKVKIVMSESEGQPIGTMEEEMTVGEAKLRCIHNINGFCVTPNSSSPCNLTNNGCRNGNPVVETYLK